MSNSVRAFVLALAIGLVLLVIAAIHDRRARLRAERVEIAPDDNPSPDAPPGRRYLRLVAAPFTADERARVEQWRGLTTTQRIEASLADPRLATHLAPPTCIVHDAVVLVCEGPITEVREVMGVCQRTLDAGRTLLLVAPECGDAVVEMLAVNLHAGSLASCVAIASDAARVRVRELTGAAGVPASDLRSGYLPQGVFGRADQVVCDGTGLWIGAGDPDEP
ncbi:MAG: hypothetical protein M0Z51_14435 [Propionibacterium sp.]|nr:hypothetical protein [Propionibacterium sp.]